MADTWSTVLFRATYAGLPILVLSTRDSFRRAVVRHEYPNRNGAIVDDHGAAARVCEVVVVFFDPWRPHPDDPEDFASRNHVDRCRAFVDATQSGKAREFVHPLFGAFPAKVENLEVSAGGEGRDQISVSCSFVEDGLDPAPLSSAVARPIEGGAAAVNVEAEAALAELDGLEDELDPVASEAARSTVDEARLEAEAWDSDPDLDARAITAGLQRASTKIDDAVRELDLASNARRYPLYRALARLHAQIRAAATRARRDAPALITIEVAAAAPLRAILADVYGAPDADRYFDEAIRLNGISDPSLVDAGSELTLSTPAPIAAQRTRRTGPAYAR